MAKNKVDPPSSSVSAWYREPQDRLSLVPFADEFFRLAHHDATGRLLLSSPVTAVGLSAALLVELAFSRRIKISDGSVRVEDAAPPADALSHRVLDLISGEPNGHTIRTWLAFLRTFAYEAVAERMT
ncbi:GOLPH3/VPS74 family protein, partial [Mangrovihabitans endophyticus]|uniref:GOLPH3/VPS74 family protein n=1 Tax=Mangrovihabitans endophyticus TaxID=1751298 RepID=UPI001664F72D